MKKTIIKLSIFPIIGMMISGCAVSGRDIGACNPFMEVNKSSSEDLTCTAPKHIYSQSFIMQVAPEYADKAEGKLQDYNHIPTMLDVVQKQTNNTGVLSSNVTLAVAKDRADLNRLMKKYKNSEIYTGLVTDFSDLFKDDYNKHIAETDSYWQDPKNAIEGWDTTNVTNMDRTFMNAGAEVISQIKNWYTPNLESMEDTFKGARIPWGFNIGHWNTVSLKAKFRYMSVMGLGRQNTPQTLLLTNAGSGNDALKNALFNNNNGNVSGYGRVNNGFFKILQNRMSDLDYGVEKQFACEPVKLLDSSNSISRTQTTSNANASFNASLNYYSTCTNFFANNMVASQSELMHMRRGSDIGTTKQIIEQYKMQQNNLPAIQQQILSNMASIMPKSVAEKSYHPDFNSNTDNLFGEFEFSQTDRSLASMKYNTINHLIAVHMILTKADQKSFFENDVAHYNLARAIATNPFYAIALYGNGASDGKVNALRSQAIESFNSRYLAQKEIQSTNVLIYKSLYALYSHLLFSEPIEPQAGAVATINNLKALENQAKASKK